MTSSTVKSIIAPNILYALDTRGKTMSEMLLWLLPLMELMFLALAILSGVFSVSGEDVERLRPSYQYFLAAVLCWQVKAVMSVPDHGVRSLEWLVHLALTFITTLMFLVSFAKAK